MKCAKCDAPAVGIFFGAKKSEILCWYHACESYSIKKTDLIKDLTTDNSLTKIWNNGVTAMKVLDEKPNKIR
jgi:hypothetical protein